MTDVPMRRWTVTRIWRGVEAASAQEAMTASRPGEHVDTSVVMTSAACQATSIMDILNNARDPQRCGDTAVARIVLDFCSALECMPTACHGHEVCEMHLRHLADAQRIKHETLL